VLLDEVFEPIEAFSTVKQLQNEFTPDIMANNNLNVTSIKPKESRLTPINVSGMK